MNRYKNLSGTSGVKGYESTGDSITVYFQDGSVYLYNSVKPGERFVRQMLILAEQGRGLNSFINTTVKKNYARKRR